MEITEPNSYRQHTSGPIIKMTGVTPYGDSAIYQTGTAMPECGSYLKETVTTLYVGTQTVTAMPTNGSYTAYEPTKSSSYKKWTLQNDSNIDFSKFQIKSLDLNHKSNTFSMKIESHNNAYNDVTISLLKWLNKFADKQNEQYHRGTYLHFTNTNVEGKTIYKILCKNLRLHQFEQEIADATYSSGIFQLEFGATNIDMEFPE